MQGEVRIEPFMRWDLRHINEWLSGRKLPEIDFEDIPEMGFIVSAEDCAVCAGFLRKCEGNVGIIDSLISNPQASSESRHICIDLLVEKLIAEASSLGMTRLLAFSVDQSVLKRSLKHGFKLCDHYTIVREAVKEGN